MEVDVLAARRRCLHGSAKRLLREGEGQATVELAVMFPAALAIAAVMTNALLALSICAEFNRQACSLVRVYAASPEYGQSVWESAEAIERALGDDFQESYLRCRVFAQGVSNGHMRYTATLDFAPMLFGFGLKSELFGVSLPHAVHSVSLVVDPYKPGVVV